MIHKSYVEDLQLFVDYMNIKYKCIKFTSKTEHDSYLSFQDIKLPVNQKFKTLAYRKQNFSGAFRHYESCLDESYKMSFTGTLSCCFSICSDYMLLHLKVENLREFLKMYSYPSGITEQSIKSFSNKFYVPRKVIQLFLKRNFL